MEIDSEERIQEGIDTEITISISVPFPVLPTKSLTTADEETINTIELLVFDAAGKYLYTSNAADISVDPGNSDIRKFTAVLKTGSVDIMLLANCRDIINEYYPTGIEEGTYKNDIISKLVLSVNDKWITDKTSNDYRNIPMWGEIGLVNITSSTTILGSNPFDIHRMVARVDVTTSLPSNVDFKLTSVRLYHYNDKGRVIPLASDFSSDKPSVPVEANRTTGPVVYDGTAITNDGNGNPACIREIYLFEAEAGNRFTHPEHVCLVVGGEYKGIPGFYRIDFQQTTTQGKKYLDILRNHHYQVVITHVEDIGFPDPDEAHDAYPVNINTQIIDWTDYNTDDINIGGDYILKLSTDQLVFNPSGGTQMMYIYTNHPQGWKFVEDNFIPSVSWIRFDPVFGVQGDFTEVKVTVEENTDTNLRFYEFPLVVDNVKKDLMFAQRGTADVDLEIYVTPNPVLLGKNMTAPVELKVSTYPANTPLYFDYTGDIFWHPTYTIPADGSVLSTIQLLPLFNHTNDQLKGFLTIYIKDTYGHIASCIVEFQQTTKITGFNATLSNPYPAIPGNYTFKLESTVPWQVDYISDGFAWIPSFGMSIQQPTVLSDKTFSLSGNPLYADREIEVSFHAPEAGEYETLNFKQLHIAPQLNATDGLTVSLPALTGQKVVHKFETNANWTIVKTDATWSQVAAEINTSLTGSGVAYNLEQTGIEFETIDYPLATSTPAAGTKTVQNVFSVNITDYSPYVLTSNQNTLWYKIERQVPPIVEINMPQGYLYCYGPYDNLYHWTAAPTSEKYVAMTNSGQHELQLRCWTNTSFDAWTSFDVNNKVTYTYTNNTMVNSATVRLPIPANDTKVNREFTVYVQPHNTTEIKTFLFEQRGQNITVSVVSPTGNIPTGGMHVTIKIEDPAGWMNSNNKVAVLFADDDGLMIINKALADYNTHITINSYTYSAPGEYKIPISSHPGTPQANRKIKVVYGVQNEIMTNGSSYAGQIFAGVHVAATLSQDWQNHKLQSGYTISRGNILLPRSSGMYPVNTSNWTTAMGINDDYLTKGFFYGQSYDSYNYPTLTGVEQVALSCASYTEPDKPNMSWRVPTIAELEEMYNNRNTIGGFQNPSIADFEYNYYWSSEEYSSENSTTAYMYLFAPIRSTSYVAGTSIVHFKTGTYSYISYSPRLRCVSRTK